MSEGSKRFLALRALLTETLPYEVPVIFSNESFHGGLSAGWPSKFAKHMSKLTERRGAYTIPYSYGISKDQHRKTTLAIVHPLMQLEMAKFVEDYSATILSSCSNGNFSLRRPISVASPFLGGSLQADESSLKSGVVQILVEAGEPDISHLVSYFAYGKYNLLGKFVSSREFLRLEARHQYYRSIDVSKCFYNIYTHSISWAVKDKLFSKENVRSYSFESRFDKIMQESNYNETNGIVVGPELSRIFAEVILQDVDGAIERRLSERGLYAGQDYDIRRYVDDYFVFSSDQSTLDKVEQTIRLSLEEFKLFVNEKKVETHERPFVSSITMARKDIGGLVKAVGEILNQIRRAPKEPVDPRTIRRLKSEMQDVRLVVAKYGIDFANISGWMMARLKGVLGQCLRLMEHPEAPASSSVVGDIAIGILEVAFYICAVDLRVRTTYSICQMSMRLKEAKDKFSQEQYDLIQHIITRECASIAKSASLRMGDDFGRSDSVEIYNILICGAAFVGVDFVNSDPVKAMLKKLAETPRLRYFAYITLIFCYRVAGSAFKHDIDAVNSKALGRITADDVDIMRDAEEYLFACDYLSSPEVSAADKRGLLIKLFGGDVSKNVADGLGEYISFADWEGVRVEHFLRRKELRPVYALG